MGVTVARLIARPEEMAWETIRQLAERTEPFCPLCDGIALFYDPPGWERQLPMNEGHFAARFGDCNGGFTVYENDEVLTKAYEVQAGDPGWVLEDATHGWERRGGGGGNVVPYCYRHSLPLMRVRIGNFRVER